MHIGANVEIFYPKKIFDLKCLQGAHKLSFSVNRSIRHERCNMCRLKRSQVSILVVLLLLLLQWKEIQLKMCVVIFHEEDFNRAKVIIDKAVGVLSSTFNTKMKFMALWNAALKPQSMKKKTSKVLFWVLFFEGSCRTLIVLKRCGTSCERRLYSLVIPSCSQEGHDGQNPGIEWCTVHQLYLVHSTLFIVVACTGLQKLWAHEGTHVATTHISSGSLSLVSSFRIQIVFVSR